MSDHLPGSSQTNPIVYRGYYICLTDEPEALGIGFDWWDPNLIDVKGYGDSVEDCKRQIDAIEKGLRK